MATALAGLSRARAALGPPSFHLELFRHRIGDRLVERRGAAEFRRRAQPAVGTDLIDAVIDLELVAVRIEEVDAGVAAGAFAALEDDRDVVGAEIIARL